MDDICYYHLALLSQLEEYIPFMLDEEIIYIIFVGSIPAAECITRWEMAKRAREDEIERRFDIARANQKQKLAKNLQVVPRANY